MKYILLWGKMPSLCDLPFLVGVFNCVLKVFIYSNQTLNVGYFSKV